MKYFIKEKKSRKILDKESSFTVQSLSKQDNIQFFENKEAAVNRAVDLNFDSDAVMISKIP